MALVPRPSHPDFVASSVPVKADDHLDVKSVRHDERDGEGVDDGDEQHGRLDLHPLAVGVADDDEPVQRDDRHGQGRPRKPKGSG